jgi:hypothetical protein
MQVVRVDDDDDRWGLVRLIGVGVGYGPFSNFNGLCFEKHCSSVVLFNLFISGDSMTIPGVCVCVPPPPPLSHHHDHHQSPTVLIVIISATRVKSFFESWPVLVHHRIVVVVVVVVVVWARWCHRR